MAKKAKGGEERKAGDDNRQEVDADAFLLRFPVVVAYVLRDHDARDRAYSPNDKLVDEAGLTSNFYRSYCVVPQLADHDLIDHGEGKLQHGLQCHRYGYA